jgi:hypothetical protein
MKKELDRLSRQLQQSLAEQKKLEEKIQQNIQIRNETLKMQNLIEADDGTIFDPASNQVIWACSCNAGQLNCSSDDQKHPVQGGELSVDVNTWMTE